jgi:hypothetical protein
MNTFNKRISTDKPQSCGTVAPYSVNRTIITNAFNKLAAAR